MRVQLRDPEIAGSIRPVDLVAYLRSRGWQTVHEELGRYSVWTLDGSGQTEEEIVCPLTRDLADYPLRVGDLLRSLAQFEDRSPLSILTDLLHATADVIRFRVANAQTDGGEIPFSLGAALVQSTRDMALAAACSAVQPKPVHPTRKPTEAVNYMARVRMGQTERGSFVVTLVSDVPLAVQQPLSEELVSPWADEPFERQVTRTLYEGLRAANTAADATVSRGDYDSFEGAVEKGVSANLCDAIAAVGQGIGSPELEVRFSWATQRPVTAEIDPNVKFNEDTIAVLGQAARVMKRNGPFEDETIVGIVENLHRGEDEEIGTATIATVVLGRVGRVRVDLDPHWYSVATHAHDQQIAVSCTGTLVKVGKFWELQDPGPIRLVEPSNDER